MSEELRQNQREKTDFWYSEGAFVLFIACLAAAIFAGY